MHIHCFILNFLHFNCLMSAIVLCLSNMVLLLARERITYSVSLPEISKWQQSLHLLSFTVNSWEHICSTTHWFLSASHHEAVHFVCLHFCMETVTDWLVLIQWSTSMVTCFPVWILIKHEPVFFSQGCVLAVRVGAVFLALICSCSSECHQIFTVPSLMSQLSILLASFISFDTEK